MTAVAAPHLNARTAWLAAVADATFALAVLSLFYGLKTETALGYLRPFEPLTVICVGLTLLMYGRSAAMFMPAIGAGALFLAWHTISASTVSVQNGLREGLQSASILMFVCALVVHCVRRPQNRIAAYLCVGIIAMAVYVALWHIANGILAGYKHLGEAKAAFLALPAAVAGLLTARTRMPMGARIAVIGAMLVLMLLAGERKAYLCAVLFCMLLIGLSPLRLALCFVAGFAAIMAAMAFDQSGYVAGQFRSFGALWSPDQNFGILSYELYPESISNAQRQFALQAGIEFLQRSPLIGIGVNEFAPAIAAANPTAPRYLLVSIHSEFIRTAVESGLIGFVLYVSAWVTGVVYWVRARRTANLTLSERQAQVLIVVGALVFCAFESSKSLTMLAIFAPILAPLLLQGARRVAPSDMRLRQAETPAAPAPRSLWRGGI